MTENGTTAILAAIAELGSQTGGAIAELRSETGGAIARLETQIDQLRQEDASLRADFLRLRTDLMGLAERLLNEMGAVRDDMTVVMARLDRVDTTTHGAVIELRGLHKQIARVTARVTELESRP